MTGRPIRRLVEIGATGVLIVGLTGAGPADASVHRSEPRQVTAADAALSFDPPRSSAAYGDFVRFEQRVRITDQPVRVEILLEFAGALGPHVVEVVPPNVAAGSLDLFHVLDVADGHILPNTPIGARWRITAADGSVETGPRTTVRYEDTRFRWRTLVGDLVRVHWYGGNAAFGRRALDIAERSVAETSEVLGVSESEPIDFFIYADRVAFYDALGPGTRENVGGQANSEIRTLFALIAADAIDDPWVGIVIPHELVHLVFATTVDNPYHFPPRWLNEGLAVYLSTGYAADDRREVEAAVRRDELIPLDGLSGQFPTTRDEFFLGYAESVSAVDFLVATHGRDALVSLIRSYANGMTDDEAFRAALGVDMAAFDAAWRTSVGARPPVVHGPRPAPPGPVPPGWDVPVVVGGNGSPAPGSGSPPGTSPGPGDPVGDDGTSPEAIATGAAVGFVAAISLVVIVIGLRGRRREAGQ